MLPRICVRAALLTSLAAGCAAPRLELEPQFTPLELDGRLAATSGGATTAASLDDLNLDNDGVEAGGRIDVKWGSPHLSVSYTPGSFSGDGHLTAPFTFGGTTIAAGTSVSSDFRFNVASGALTFDVLPVPDVELGIGLGVAAVDFRGRISDPASGSTIVTSNTIPVPLLAGRVTWEIWRLEAALLVSGFDYSIDGDSMAYYDVDAQLRFRFLGDDGHLQGYIGLGYRQIGADFAYDDGGTRVKSDATLKGPFLGLVLGF
jgi:hypothetical protein